MNSENVKSAIKTSVLCGKPVFLWGPPGVGKSDCVRQAAAAMGRDIVDIRASLLDPVDLRGVPSIGPDGRARWAVPEFWPTSGSGIIFLDEVNAAAPMTMAGLYQLVLDKRIGEYVVPDAWAIIAAGNRETDRAVTSRMPSALANRFIHIQFDVDLGAWVMWALGAGVRTDLIAFLRYRPALLHVFDSAKNEKAFPSPRAWETVSRIMQAAPDPGVEYEMISGTVGEGAAAEYLGFRRIYQALPNLDKVRIDPLAVPVPDDPAALYAVAGAIGRRITEQSVDNYLAYVRRLPAEFGVLTVRDAVHYHPEITGTRAYIAWESEHANITM